MNDKYLLKSGPDHMNVQKMLFENIFNSDGPLDLHARCVLGMYRCFNGNKYAGIALVKGNIHGARKQWRRNRVGQWPTHFFDCVGLAHSLLALLSFVFVLLITTNHRLFTGSQQD